MNAMNREQWRPGMELPRDPWRPFMVGLVRLADCIVSGIASVEEYLRIWGDVDPFIPMAANGCSCAFCTGRKRHEDNWCSRCANVRMSPPKHWENVDVCDGCEDAIRAENARAEPAPDGSDHARETTGTRR